MHSSKEAQLLRPTECEALLRIARTAIAAGVRGSSPFVPLSELPEVLRVLRATFVTITIGGKLRGCIGTLEAFRPLATDVAENAQAAAFEDPRFAPVTADEAELLEVHISLLHPAEPLTFESEDHLIDQLRPGIDGLILIDRGRRATFLPSVWESLPDPRDFLRHLKLKAGLPAESWPQTLRAERYTVSSIF